LGKVVANRELAIVTKTSTDKFRSRVFKIGNTAIWANPVDPVGSSRRERRLGQRCEESLAVDGGTSPALRVDCIRLIKRELGKLTYVHGKDYFQPHTGQSDTSFTDDRVPELLANKLEVKEQDSNWMAKGGCAC
jgi:hypothetical protein